MGKSVKRIKFRGWRIILKGLGSGNTMPEFDLIKQWIKIRSWRIVLKRLGSGEAKYRSETRK